MNKILETFKNNVDSVEGLINFDKEVLALAISGIEECSGQVKLDSKI